MRSGLSGLGSRQEIAVADVNDSLAHLSRVDPVLPDQVFEVAAMSGGISVKVVLNLCFVVKQDTAPAGGVLGNRVVQ